MLSDINIRHLDVGQAYGITVTHQVSVADVGPPKKITGAS